ncbi:phage DNA ejection protein [Pectobacterium brasiliense]|uniref:phage DNA ejection protein n=1 Tax=Pectobacterium brasiliense TaxID=180957 RepID=UPI0019696334|nr:phage DNA ejection protein [Pectobacterium brasiliense]MBN3043350.1 phage DNA ejection protein [Pectobacterium brasiliense]
MAIGPIDYSGGNGFLQGLRAYSGMQEVQQQRMQAEQAAAQQEALKAFQSDWKSAYGDPAKMDALVAKYPGQLDTIKNAIGFQDDNHRMALGNAARDLRVAMSSNNPQAIQQAATQHAQTLSSIGSSPQDVMEQLRTNPQGLAQTIDAVGMSALGAKDFYGVQNDRAQRQNDTAKLAEQIRSNRAGEAVQWANVGIAQQNADIRRSELREQALNRQVAREGNELRQEQLRQEMASNREKSMQAKTDVVGAYDSQMNQVNNMLDTVNQVKGNGTEPQQGQPDPRIKPEVFDRIFGFGGSVNSMIPGSESADAWQKIQQMQGQARLMGVIGMKGTGPVSDSEGQAAAKAFLSINQSMSPNAARAAINNWEQVLRRQEAYLNKQRPTVDRYRSEIDTNNQRQQPASNIQSQGAQQQDGYSNLWGG